MLKAVNHIQPETVPVNIMGFDPADRWLEHFGATDMFDLRAKIGLDVQFARPVYFGPNATGGCDIWGKDTSTMGATTLAEIDRCP
jgi:hypothetical protein